MSHVRRRSLDFSTIVGRPTHWLTFFARRSTLVARALGETRIGWTLCGCGWWDATGRDATLRYATLFSLLLSCRRCSSNRGRKQRQKDERVDALLRRLGRPAGLSRVNTRRQVEKKGSHLPTFRTHTSTCTPRGKKDEASVKKRRVGGCSVGGERESRRPRKGGKEGREKDIGKGVGWRARGSATKTDDERGTDEGASREGKDVGREGRNRSLMRWWGSYIR